MKRVNDIFYSLQGEGYHTGRAALFVRFAGCNLKCPFCDTEFDSYHEWSEDYIISELLAHCIDHGVLSNMPLVVLTGGEPTLQADKAFVNLLHRNGFYVAMESNGILPAPQNLDWLTVSPKSFPGEHAQTSKGRSKPRIADEIKVVFTGEHEPEELLLAYLRHTCQTEEVPTDMRLYLQPCDTGNKYVNGEVIDWCVNYVKCHPRWRLSLQTHKLIGIE